MKHRLPYLCSPADRDRLTAESLAFVAEHAGLEGAHLLSPVLTTAYRRRTLVDLAAGTRLTCDRGLVCTTVDGRSVSLPDHLLVETKSTGPATGADRFLWRAGCRPEPVSKFCVGLAALHSDLPVNRWHRTLRRYLDR